MDLTIHFLDVVEKVDAAIRPVVLLRLAWLGKSHLLGREALRPAFFGLKYLAGYRNAQVIRYFETSCTY